VALELGIEIRAPRERVHAELRDPARHLGLQPLLVRVSPHADGRGFDAVERVPLAGPLAWRNRLRVEIDPGPAPERIGFRARTAGVQVWSAFEIAEGPGETSVVRERFGVRLPPWLRPLRGWVERRARDAQRALLDNLRARLEAAPIDGGPDRS